MNSLIELIAFTITEDALKQQIKVPSYRQVYADEQDTYGDEFARAGQMGIKAKKIFGVHPHEYDGEEELRHNGTVYHIYRIAMSRKTGLRELYCEVRIGGN